jgi:hypothetical protein
MNLYWLAGLRIVSELPLSGLLPSDAAATGDTITIRRASIPEKLHPPTTIQDEAEYDGSALLFTVPEVGRYLIRDGSEILIDAQVSADKNDVRAYLLGSAFGTLCHQRDILPLHSAAIDVADGCVAFIGHSGAGKSTLAATLSARGHQVIADDVSFLRRDNDGNVIAWPGIGRIRLWEDAVTALACNGPGVERELRGYNKYLVPIPAPGHPNMPRRLRRIYHLDTAPAGTAATINRVRGASAIDLLMQNVYCASFAACMGRKPATFAICTAAARQIPLFRFNRPMGFHVLQSGIEVLEDHLRKMW